MERDELAAELHALTEGLRGHIEWLRDTGVTGLERADHALAESRREAPVEAIPEVSAPAADAAQSTARAVQPPPQPNARRAAPMPMQQPPPPALAASNPPPQEAPAGPPPITPIDPEQARTRLAVIEDEARSCTRCGLHEQRTNVAFARGTGSSGICFVGEGPGADEDAQGVPFVGKAGQLLDKMIHAMGLERDEVYVCNVVKCRPPNNRKPEASELDLCRSFIEQQLELIAPKVIVCLGGSAVEGLLGMKVGITRMRGSWRMYRGIPVMPTFHPAYLLRTPSAKRQVWDDLQEVLRSQGREPRGKS